MKNGAMNPCRTWAVSWMIAFFSGCFVGARAVGAEATASPEPSLYDKIWGRTEWYNNPQNPLIEKFQFTGRFQLDYGLIDSDQGDHDEWNIRRFRLGGKAQLFQDFTLHAEVDLNPQEPTPLYQRLTDMYVAWSRDQALVVTIGKQSAPFTLEGSTSSKELVTIDRGNLANNLWFPDEYFPGVSLSGKTASWHYFAGIFSNGSRNPEFGEFNASAFFVGNLGYDLARQLRVKEAVVMANYVYNNPDIRNDWTRKLEHIGSVNFRFDTGKWGIRADLSGGTGYFGQSDLWGGELLPFYNITDKLQAVARYTHVESSGNNGVRLALYENLVVPGRGDRYDEIYAGLNYYFYGHKLKVQTGVQYAAMRDQAHDGGRYSGWAWTTGLRLAW